MSPIHETTAAYVLRRVDYKESDRILTLFTRSHGKISALARGARKSNKRFAGPLEPFVLLEVTLDAPIGGRMRAVNESTLLDGAAGLSKRMERLNAAAFVVEMIRESLPEEAPEPRLFDLMRETLSRLAELEGARLHKSVTAFQLKLLVQLGTPVTVTQCATCGKPVPEGRPVYFHPGRGGVICTPCGGGPLLLSSSAISALRALSINPLADAVDVEISESDEREVERALTAFIEHHLAGPLMTRTAFLGR